MSQPIEIKLPWPAKALHSNSRAHWAVKAASVKLARRQVPMLGKLPCWPDAEIMVEYYPPSLRGDPQNVPASLKAYIDGIADAMGCSDKLFRVDYPSVFAGTKKGGEVVFRIYPNSQSKEQ